MPRWDGSETMRQHAPTCSAILACLAILVRFFFFLSLFSFLSLSLCINFFHQLCSTALLLNCFLYFYFFLCDSQWPCLWKTETRPKPTKTEIPPKPTISNHFGRFRLRISQTEILSFGWPYTYKTDRTEPSTPLKSWVNSLRPQSYFMWVWSFGGH